MVINNNCCRIAINIVLKYNFKPREQVCQILPRYTHIFLYNFTIKKIKKNLDVPKMCNSKSREQVCQILLWCTYLFLLNFINKKIKKIFRLKKFQKIHPHRPPLNPRKYLYDPHIPIWSPFIPIWPPYDKDISLYDPVLTWDTW